MAVYTWICLSCRTSFTCLHFQKLLLKMRISFEYSFYRVYKRRRGNYHHQPVLCTYLVIVWVSFFFISLYLFECDSHPQCTAPFSYIIPTNLSQMNSMSKSVSSRCLFSVCSAFCACLLGSAHGIQFFVQLPDCVAAKPNTRYPFGKEATFQHGWTNCIRLLFT